MARVEGRAEKEQVPEAWAPKPRARWGGHGGCVKAWSTRPTWCSLLPTHPWAWGFRKILPLLVMLSFPTEPCCLLPSAYCRALAGTPSPGSLRDYRADCTGAVCSATPAAPRAQGCPG